MGMSYTGFGAPVTTKNLQANADLNLGNYDLIATDVKGDTAEFDEFVGGVGNFSNVLSSGNLDIEGTGNIKGLTTFQNAVQVNGALHVEGSINNVNIADNGEITTAQGVNGADFNGATITATKFNGATIDASGNITGATLTRSTSVNVSSATPSNSTQSLEGLTCLLPYAPSITYTGSVKVRNTYTSPRTLLYATNLNEEQKSVSVGGSSTTTITFNGIKCLYIAASSTFTWAELTLT